MNFKYLLGMAMSIPLLPIMYYQAKRIRRKTPRLPEAKVPVGVVDGLTGHNIRLVALGESTVAGVGVDTHKEGFTGTLAKALATMGNGVAWSVHARSGYTARQLREKTLSNIEHDKADIVVVGIGANDAFKLNTPKRWRQDTHRLIEAIKGKFGDSPIVFANMPPIKAFPAFTPLIKFVVGNLASILGKELEKVVARHGHVYFYSRDIELGHWQGFLPDNASLADFFSDGVHPSKMAYQAWAKDLGRYIIETPAIRNQLKRSVRHAASI